jgi:hypothetical protein
MSSRQTGLKACLYEGKEGARLYEGKEETCLYVGSMIHICT